MTFWAYMLHCRGGYFYVGHTDDLERRLGQHRLGAIPGFTADQLPVELVWSQEFGDRPEAKAAELRVKGWSRAKKLALIRGDWEEISRLAKTKGSPSTSSGRTEIRRTSERTSSGGSDQRKTSATKVRRPERVEGLHLVRGPLIPHPDTKFTSPFEVWATAELSAAFGASATLNLWYGVRAPASRFVLPAGSGERRDQLWRTTCFEAFLGVPDSPAYREWNFAPSGDWAAYAFDDYRAGMRPAEVAAPPYIRLEDNLTWWTLGATIAVPAGEALRLGLSAVLEEQDGTTSYWALAHGDGPPDFHAPACFIARIP